MIESLQNPWVKKVASLHQTKGRKETGLILVEGPHSIQEALRSEAEQKGVVLEKLFLLEAQTLSLLDLSEESMAHCSNRLEQVSTAVMKKMATTETPPPVLGLFRLDKSSNEILSIQTLLQKIQATNTPPCWVILDRLQDPGNVGTIIRSALAFGATGVITTQNSVDVYSPKVIRSSTGLVFACTILESELRLQDLIECVLVPAGLTVYVGVGHSDTPDYRSADFSKPMAMILGQEGTGIEAEVLDQQKNLKIHDIRIPMENGVESLNVSISAAVMLAEMQTQRMRSVAPSLISKENN
jgi:TrmH family RNA methyltransferase